MSDYTQDDDDPAITEARVAAYNQMVEWLDLPSSSFEYEGDLTSSSIEYKTIPTENVDMSKKYDQPVEK